MDLKAFQQDIFARGQLLLESCTHSCVCVCVSFYRHLLCLLFSVISAFACIVWTSDENIHTTATVEVTGTPGGLYMNAMLRPFLYGPRSHPPVTVMEKLPRVGKQGKGVQQWARSSTKGEPTSPQAEFWSPLLLHKSHFNVK